MSYKIVNVNFAVHVPVDDFRYVGAALGATKCGTLPDTAGDQLERPRCYFRAGWCDANDHRNTPALVAAFQRRTHHFDIAYAFKGIVCAAVGNID